MEQQLAVVQQTDILVGMHGAALAHALLLPPHAALVELWPQVGIGRLLLGPSRSRGRLPWHRCREASALDFAPLPRLLSRLAKLCTATGCPSQVVMLCRLSLVVREPLIAMWLPWLQADGIWRCYQNFAQWAGALYRRVANQDPSRYRNTPQGDVTDIDAAELAQAVRELLPLVAARRAAGRRSSELGAAGAELRQEEGEEL